MKPYIQTTQYTTGVSSFINILQLLKEIEPTRELELSIWKQTANLPTRAPSIYSLALIAKQHNLNPKIIVGTTQFDYPDYRFYRFTKEDVELAALSEAQSIQEAKNNQIEIIHKEIQFQEIIQELQNKNALLVRLNTKTFREEEKRNSSSYIALTNINENKIEIIDPTQGILTLNKEVIQESFESLIEKKHRDARMIIFKREI